MILKLLAALFSKIMLLFGRIGSEPAFEKPLSREEEQECFAEIAAGDKSAENKLVKHNMRLVAHVIRKYKGSISQDELISVGAVGLLKAIKSFSYQKGGSFSTYATRCIDNEVLMLLRADKKHAGQIYLEDSISTDKEGNEFSLLDIVPDSAESIEDSVSTKLEFEKIVKLIEKHLTEREQKIIFMRYGVCGYNQYTQMEISKMLGISRSYISRIEKHAMQIIKNNAI